MRKILWILFIVALGLNMDTIVARAMVETSRVLPLKCVSAVVIDQDSMRVLYDKNGDMPLPMASTTKIVTAIVAIEKSRLDRRVTVSNRAARIGGSSAGLKNGEVVTMEELLYGLMLRSGNDAAIAIAEAVGGTVDHFVDMMNDKAFELGLYNTNFTSPHGLDQNEHVTTANELARATAYALGNSFFSAIVSTKTIKQGTYGVFNRSYSNINKFLYRRENADGVKTGYTGNAGKCLIASEKKAKCRYIAVVLNSSDRWRDAERLIEYAENNYKQVKICNKGIITKKIIAGNVHNGNLNGCIKKDFYVPIRSDGSEKPDVEFFIPSIISSTAEKDRIIGNITVCIKGKIISFTPIYIGN